MILEILIPTFNRAPYLQENLAQLVETLRVSSLESEVGISISDNASTDGTNRVIDDAIRSFPDISIRVHVQGDNVGLERNALSVLEKAESEWVMFLGDDDYLPDGYIDTVLERIKTDSDLACIIPGLIEVFSDGSTGTSRRTSFSAKRFPAGLWTVMRLVRYGHQLSGLTFRRDGVADAYESMPELRNIYLFMFFIAYNMLRGATWYMPDYDVRVSQGIPKDWGYDPANLIPEILLNLRMLFPKRPFVVALASGMFMVQQYWRLEVNTSFGRAWGAFSFILASPKVPVLVKITLPLVFATAAAYHLLVTLKMRFLDRR